MLDVHGEPIEKFPFVRSEGTAFDVGRSHGAAFGEQVAHCIELYRQAFATAGAPPWPEILEMAATAGERIRDHDPNLAAELDGIAAGADVDPREIYALNIRSGVLRRADVAQKMAPAECTTAACLPEATADGHTLLAQNWDKFASCGAHTVVIEQHTVGEPALLFVTEAGILYRNGMTDAGIGIVGNSLSSDRERSSDGGVPGAVARRKALRQRDLSSAVREIVDSPRDMSGNHMLASASEGAAIDLEAVPDEVFTVEAEGGVLAHSNHFLNADACAVLEDRLPPKHPSTLYRDCRVRDALSAKRGTVTVDDVKEALRDHHMFPEAVCTHPKDPDGPRSVATVSSNVMDLTAGQMWVAPGAPCENDYTLYEFSY